MKLGLVEPASEQINEEKETMQDENLEEEKEMSESADEEELLTEIVGIPKTVDY